MKRNVLTWNQALENGYEPKDYPYDLKDIPEGSYKAKIDFKIWVKKTMAVCCYFIFIEMNKKCCITIYRNKFFAYEILNSDINFTECTIKTIYTIEMGYNKNQKMF